MKKINVVYLILALLVGSQSINASVVNNYLEKFNNLKLTPEASFAPSKWGRIVDNLVSTPSGWDDIPDVYVSYTNPTTGGQDGAYLKAGSQNLVNSDFTESKTANDILVSPAVTGEVSFYAKSTNSNGNIKIYVCTKSGDKYVKGELYKDILKTEISTTEWTKFTLPAVPAGTFLGFRLENVSIDEFSAASAEISANYALSVNSIKLLSPLAPKADSDNKITISYEVTIANTGDATLNPGDTNYSVSMVNNTQKNAVVLTQDIDFALEPGKISAPFTVSVTFDAGLAEKRERYDVKENITGTSKAGSWIESMPYIAKFSFLTSTNADITSTINYGYVQATPIKKDFKVKNSGAAPLNITSITLPKGFTSDLVAPLEIASGSEITFSITLGVETEGNISGNIVFATTQIGDKVYAVNGSVIGASNWYENFENGLPADMFFGDNWKLSTFPKDVKLENNMQCAENGLASSMTYAVSPKLIIAEGESLAFNAAQISSSSVLNVYYSSDRSNWTKVKEIKTTTGAATENTFSNEKAGSNYGQFKFKQFIVNSIPAGEYYVAFESGYARLDDIFGYKKVNVSHDLYFLSQATPKTATVNNEYAATVSFKNLCADEAAGTYSVELIVSDEKVATAESVSFPAGDSKTFKLNYTPHVSGTVKAYFKVSAGDYIVTTPEFSITIAKEQNVNKIIVGEKTASSGNAPLGINYKNSISETVYTASLLGLKTGANLSKIAYTGYCTATKAMTNHVKVWIENTSDAKPSSSAPRDVAEMKLVFDGSITIPAIGSSLASEELITIPLSENFAYSGENIRIVISSESDTYKVVYFDVCTAVTDATIYRSSDGDISKADWKAEKMPVINLYEETEPVTYSGIVKDEKANLLEGASIVLTSGNVIYSAITDIKGEYNIPVYQNNKEYSVEVSFKDYVKINKTVSFTQGNVTDDFTLQPVIVGVDIVSGNKSEIIGGEGKIFVNVDKSTKVNVFTISGVCIHSEIMPEGANVIDNVSPGFYIVNNKKIVVR